MHRALVKTWFEDCGHLASLEVGGRYFAVNEKDNSAPVGSLPVSDGKYEYDGSPFNFNVLANDRVRVCVCICVGWCIGFVSMEEGGRMRTSMRRGRRRVAFLFYLLQPYIGSLEGSHLFGPLPRVPPSLPPSLQAPAGAPIPARKISIAGRNVFPDFYMCTFCKENKGFVFDHDEQKAYCEPCMYEHVVEEELPADMEVGRERREEGREGGRVEENEKEKTVFTRPEGSLCVQALL